MTRKVRQLPLDLGYREGTSRDDLVVTAANAEAVSLIDRWPDWPAPFVVLAGPSGSGKSHLGAIWRDRAGATAIPAKALDARAVAAASQGPVFVDDADSRPLDETRLFHLMNAARGSGSHMLLTARRFPAAWGTRLPDLGSRLRTAATVEIREPDEMLLAGVVTKLFADRQIEVEPHVVAFVVRRIERSLSSAIAIVARLDAMALEQKTRITRALAADALGALERRQGELDL